MNKEEFKIPKNVKIPILRRIANIENARWILRNISINNPQEQAMQAKAVVKDWLARTGNNNQHFLEI